VLVIIGDMVREGMNEGAVAKAIQAQHKIRARHGDELIIGTDDQAMN
jgi:hypothetical protein